MKEIDWSGEDVDQTLVGLELQNIIDNKTAEWIEVPKRRSKVEYKITTSSAVYSFFICNEGYLWLSVDRQIGGETDNITLICNESVVSIDRIIKEVDKKIRKS